MNSVILVVPPLDESYPAVQNAEGDRLGLGYLLAVLRQNEIPSEVIHCPVENLSVEACAERIVEQNPRLVGISTLFANTDAAGALDVARAIKARSQQIHVCVGGHAATFAADTILTDVPQIDSVVLGEGEQTLLELACRVLEGRAWNTIPGIATRSSGRTVVTTPRELIKDLDTLPFPARDLQPRLPPSQGICMLTSRGCPYRCSYCSIHPFYKKATGKTWRGRSPENIADEVESLKREWQASFIEFNDDNFIGPGQMGKERAYKIGKELIRRKLDVQLGMECRADSVEEELFAFLKCAGLHTVCLGIESGVQRTLDLYNKNTTVEVNRRALEILNRLGFNVRIGFIGFNPLTTLADIKENIRFYQETRLDQNLVALSVFFNHLKVYGGAPLEKHLQERGVLEDASDPFKLNRNYHFLDAQTRVLAQVSRQVSERPSRRYVMGDGFRNLQRMTMATLKKATGLDDERLQHVLALHGLLTPTMIERWREQSLHRAFQTFVGMVDSLDEAREQIAQNEQAWTERLNAEMLATLEAIDEQVLGMSLSEAVERMKRLAITGMLELDHNGRHYQLPLLRAGVLEERLSY